MLGMKIDHHRQKMHFTTVDNHKKILYEIWSDSPHVHNFSKSKPIALTQALIFAA